MEGHTRSNLEDLLSCPICFEQYDNRKYLPKLLSCGHTYCLSCMEKIWVKGKGSVSCPLDSKLFQLSAASTLVSNFTILELLSIEAIRNLLRAEKAYEELRHSDSARITVSLPPPSALSTSPPPSNSFSTLHSSCVVPQSSPSSNKQTPSSSWGITPNAQRSGNPKSKATVGSISTPVQSTPSLSSSSASSSSFLSSFVNTGKAKKTVISKRASECCCKGTGNYVAGYQCDVCKKEFQDSSKFHRCPNVDICPSCDKHFDPLLCSCKGTGHYDTNPFRCSRCRQPFKTPPFVHICPEFDLCQQCAGVLDFTCKYTLCPKDVNKCECRGTGDYESKSYICTSCASLFKQRAPLHRCPTVDLCEKCLGVFTK